MPLASNTNTNTSTSFKKLSKQGLLPFSSVITDGSRRLLVRSEEIHARIDSRWPEVLERLGIDRRFLSKRHGPCPICEGKDRFRFDNKWGQGNWICSKCGSNDGFALLMEKYGWSFAVAREQVLAVAGLQSSLFPVEQQPIRSCRKPSFAAPSKPTSRVIRVVRESNSLESCPEVVEYLAGRRLWPLEPGHSLRAHARLQYWENGCAIGRFPSLVAEVRDVAGELATLGVIYTQLGKKLNVSQPKKLLSKLRGRHGCAARLFPAIGDVLGISEGVETALAAHQLYGIPVWAAWSASMLAKFEPPSGISRLVIFADHDEVGIKAAQTLAERLADRLHIETRIAPRYDSDWADFLLDGGDGAAAAKVAPL
jgi:putative DNA primase/helicase